MGEMEGTIVRQCLKTGQPLPKAIQDAPELALGLEFTYTAFWEMGTCRPVGFGVGYIPWRDILKYAEHYHLDEEATEDFMFLIRAMDKAFMEQEMEKQKAGKEKRPKMGDK